MVESTYTVEGMSCTHCERTVKSEVAGVPGVGDVEIDLAAKLVTVRGEEFDDAAVRAAIEGAGYEAAP